MDAIERRFKTLLKKQGKDIEINSVASTGLFTEIEENNSYDLKKLFTEKNVNQGDIIKGLDTYWIVTDKDANINNNHSFYKCVVTKAIHNIKIYIGNQLYEFPAIIKTQVQGINNGQYINIADGKITLITQDNDFTKKIGYDSRFIKMGSAWKVVGFTSENEGLRFLYCEKDVFDSVSDDIKGEIANRWQYETKHEYVIDANGNISLNIGETYQTAATVTDNGILIENPVLIYTSSDDTIATVDVNGLIAANNIGTTTITIKYESVEATFNVVVSEAPVVKPMILNGDYKLYLNTSKTYTITYDDGSTVTDKSFSYSFANISLATITDFTGTSVTLKANNNNVKGYCDLICTCVDDSSIVIVKSIWVRSLI